MPRPRLNLPSNILLRDLSRNIWARAAAFSLLGLAVRLWHLSQPKGLVFDEVYYVKNAHSLLLHGVEIDSSGGPEFVVHPPLGKWLIALGIKVFGYNEFGWRFSAALIGALSIGLIYLTAEKLFAKPFISAVAAILLASDGLHLVMSRTALLDIFLMFFLQLALYAIISQRHWLAGLAFGLALACKWSGIYELVAFIPVVIFMAIRARSSVRTYFIRALQYLVLPFAVYLASWTGWLLSQKGYDRHAHLNRFLALITYHFDILNFHKNLTTAHPYSANPWNWLIQSRPTAFFYQEQSGCGASKCAQEVLGIGTPILWWIGCVAILVLTGSWLARRQWRSGFILLALSSEYLPWFFIQKRTMFNFYAIAFAPAMVLAIVALADRWLTLATDAKNLSFRKNTVTALVVLVVLNFLYFLPLFTGTHIPYSTWYHRMWLPSWI
jgi:dolichyl-phosphate-mannose--protein O-mannosyl transferase